MHSELKGKRALLLIERGPLCEALQRALEEPGVRVECAVPDSEPDVRRTDLFIQCAAGREWQDGQLDQQIERLESAADAMAERNFGRLIQLVFTQATEVADDVPKAHLRAAQWRSLTATYARKYASRGVTVNLVELALVEGCNAREPLAAELLRHTPLARASSPSEVAAAVVFLAAQEAAYMTGVCLPLTGGLGLGLFPEQLR